MGGGGPSAATLCVRSCAEVQWLLEKPAALPTTLQPSRLSAVAFPLSFRGKFPKGERGEKTPPQILPKNEIWQSYPVPLCAKLSRTPFVKELWGTSGIRRKIVKFCCWNFEWGMSLYSRQLFVHPLEVCSVLSEWWDFMDLSSHKLGGNPSVFTRYLWTRLTWWHCITVSQMWNQDCCYVPHLQSDEFSWGLWLA